MREKATSFRRVLGGGHAWAPSRRGMGAVRVSIVNREAAGLFLAVLVALAWFLEGEPRRNAARKSLLLGKPSSQTWVFAISADGTRLGTTDFAGRVMIRDARKGWARERSIPFPGHARTLSFSPDGRWLVVGGTAPGITLYDLESGGEPRRLPVPVERIRVVAFSPDGRKLAVAAERDIGVLVWDIAGGRVERTYGPPLAVRSLVFSPDSRYLASGGRDPRPSVTLWDLQTSQSRFQWEVAGGPVVAMAFSPDGTWLAAASGFERTVRIWDWRSLGSGWSVEGHAFGTNGLAFAPDGRTLATAGNDGMVRLWSVATGQQQAALEGDAPAMGAVAYSTAEKSWIATSRNDNDLRVWTSADIRSVMTLEAPVLSH